MKLTTLKVSVPVLMMMMFQSGYGVSDWFMDACRELNRGNVFEAQRLFVENNPDSVEMTQQDKDEFVVKNAELIKNAIKSFIPRGFKNAEGKLEPEGKILQLVATGNLINLTDVTAANTKDSFKKTVVDNFWKNIGWLGRNDAVKEEVSGVMTTWATSDVPESGEDPRYGSFVGNKSGEDPNTVWEFIKGTEGEGYDETTGPIALDKLLNHDYLRSITRSEDFSWEPLQIDVKNASDEEAKVEAVLNDLSTRANKVRLDSIPEKNKANVPWGTGDKEGDAWKEDGREYVNASWAFVDKTGTVKERIESLRVWLYRSSAKTLAEGWDQGTEPKGYADSDEISFYLNLFNYTKINGNKDKEAPDDKETFLWKILNDIESKVSEQGAVEVVGEPGTEIRATWVENNKGIVYSLVSDTVYSVFGTTYEDSLRHSADDGDLDRQKQLVDAVIEASTAEEEEKAAEISVETLDDKTAGDVVRPIEDIHDIEQIG